MNEPVLKDEELMLLKKRAKTLGIKHHPSIGLAKLKVKVNSALAKDTAPRNDTEPVLNTPVEPAHEAIVSTVANDMPKRPQMAAKVAPMPPINRPAKTARQLKNEQQQRQRKEAMKLIRIHVTCMNPNKKNWEGEMFTVSNSVIGTVKKFVPFNNPEGWHVPMIIYKAMIEKNCQIFQSVKGKNGRNTKRAKMIKELSIEIMDPLTKTELNELAIRQARAGSIDTEE